jgi:cytosine deaminase
MLLRIATYGGAKVMGDNNYGLQAGKRADFVVVAGDAPAHAIIEQPPRTFVVKGGRVVAESGRLALQPHLLEDS